MTPAIFATVNAAPSACQMSTLTSAKTADEMAGEPLFADVMGAFLINDQPAMEPAQPAVASTVVGSAECLQATVNIICPVKTATDVSVAEPSKTDAAVLKHDTDTQVDPRSITRPSTKPAAVAAVAEQLADRDKLQEVAGPEKDMDQVEPLRGGLDEEHTTRSAPTGHRRRLREVMKRSELAEAETLDHSCLLRIKDGERADTKLPSSEIGSLAGQSVAVAMGSLQLPIVVEIPTVARERNCSGETKVKSAASASATSLDMVVASAASLFVQAVESPQSIPQASLTGDGRKVITDISTNVRPPSAPLLNPLASGSAKESVKLGCHDGVRESDLPNVQAEHVRTELDEQFDPARMESPQFVNGDDWGGYDTVALRTTPDQMVALPELQRACTLSRQPIDIGQSSHGESVGHESPNASSEVPSLFDANVVPVNSHSVLPSLATDKLATPSDNQSLGNNRSNIADLNNPMVAEADNTLLWESLSNDSQPEPMAQFLGSQEQLAINSGTSAKLPRANSDSKFQLDLPVAGDSPAPVCQDPLAATSLLNHATKGAVAVEAPKPEKGMIERGVLRGMATASIQGVMKEPNDLHTIAGPDENFLPVERESEFAEQSQREKFGIRIGEKLNHSILNTLFVAHGPEAGFQQVSPMIASMSDSASATTSTQFSVETLAQQLMDRAVKFKSLYQENMAVLVMPDDNTEIRLQFSLSGNGVDVCAWVERGNFDMLRANWDQLKLTLADHGVHVGDLNHSFSDTSNLPQSSTETNKGSSHNQAPRHQLRLNEELAEEITGGGAMTEPLHMRLHNTRRATPRRWEKWA